MFEPVSALSLQLGIAAIYSLARPGSAVSREAEVIQLRAYRAVDSLERSRALLGQKSDSLSHLSELATECSTDNWDGEEARAIDPAALDRAIDFIRALPEGVPQPEFAIEPDGEISLDWMPSRHKVLSISIGATDRLACAWIDGANRGHFVERFVGGRVPSRILSLIAETIGRGNGASVRVA